jgi:integrase
MGLTRPDVDLKRGTVRVVRSVAEVKGRFVIGPPKSRASKRVVVIPSAVVTVLRAHLRWFSEKGTEGRVFVGSKGATMRRTNFQSMWTKAVEAAGLPEGFRFHDLRHTGNTWAAESGANLRELMERMGHDSERAALIYLHSSSDSGRRIADGIDRRLSEDQASEDDVDQADDE